VTRPRSRAAVVLLFLGIGVVLGSWAARIPTLKAQVGLGDAAWGGVVLSGGIGALLAMLCVRAAISTVDARWLVLGAFPFVLLLPVLLSSVHQPVALSAGLFFQGAAMGAAQAPMNTLAAAVERTRGRPLMSSFHGSFSVGSLIGGLAGAWAARQGVSPTAQFAIGNALFAVLIIAFAHQLPRATAATPAETALARSSRKSGPIAVLGAIAFGSLLIEGACNQWSAIYLRESLGSSPQLAAVGFSAFACCMAIGRLNGDRLVNRYGNAAVIRWGAGLGALVATAGLLSRTQAGGVLAFAGLGLGLAAVVPAAMSLAGRLPGHHPGRAVASVSVAAWPATLFGPPLVGAAAGLSSLTTALTVLVPVAGLSVALLAWRLRAAPSGPAPAPTDAAPASPVQDGAGPERATTDVNAY